MLFRLLDVHIAIESLEIKKYQIGSFIADDSKACLSISAS